MPYEGWLKLLKQSYAKVLDLLSLCVLLYLVEEHVHSITALAS